MRRFLLLTIPAVITGQVYAQSGEFGKLLQSMLSCDSAYRTETYSVIAKCPDENFSEVVFLSTYSFPHSASAVIAIQNDEVKFTLASARGERYTLFKGEFLAYDLPMLARSKTTSGVVDHAEFRLDNGRSLAVDDHDHDGLIDHLVLPLGGDEYGTFQLDKALQPVRLLVFDNSAMVYRLSAELKITNGTLLAHSISYYAGDEWVDFVVNTDGSSYMAASVVHRIHDEEQKSYTLTETSSPLLHSANAKREEIAVWVHSRIVRAWAEWEANRDRVQRSGVIGYQFPVMFAMPP